MLEGVLLCVCVFVTGCVYVLVGGGVNVNVGAVSV